MPFVFEEEQYPGRKGIEIDGNPATERTITVNDPRINNGKWTNIPSIYGGQVVDQDEAIRRITEAGGIDPETGRTLQGYASLDEAELAAQQRSDSLHVDDKGMQAVNRFVLEDETERAIPKRKEKPGFFGEFAEAFEMGDLQAQKGIGYGMQLTGLNIRDNFEKPYRDLLQDELPASKYMDEEGPMPQTVSMPVGDIQMDADDINSQLEQRKQQYIDDFMRKTRESKDRIMPNVDSTLIELGKKKVKYAKGELAKREHLKRDPELEVGLWEGLSGPNRSRYIARGMGENIPNLLGGIGVGIGGTMVGGPMGGLTAAGSFTFLLESGHSYGDLIKLTGDENKAREVASAVGAVNAMLESLPIANLLNKIPGLKKAFLDEAVEEFATKPMSKRILAKGFEQALLEGGTEGLQEVVSNIGKNVFDKNQELLQGVPESMFFGALLGGGSGASMQAVTPTQKPSKPIDTGETSANDLTPDELVAKFEGIDYTPVEKSKYSYKDSPYYQKLKSESDNLSSKLNKLEKIEKKLTKSIETEKDLNKKKKLQSRLEKIRDNYSKNLSQQKRNSIEMDAAIEAYNAEKRQGGISINEGYFGYEGGIDYDQGKKGITVPNWELEELSPPVDLTKKQREYEFEKAVQQREKQKQSERDKAFDQAERERLEQQEGLADFVSKQDIESEKQPTAMELAFQKARSRKGITDPVQDSVDEFKTDAVEPAQIKTSQVEETKDITLPEGFDDPRLKRLDYRTHLKSLAGETTKGGDIALVEDEHGRIIKRTKSINPKWFQDLAANEQISVEILKKTVDRALRGDKLGVRQSRIITQMLDHVTEQRTDPENIDYVKKELANARKLRKTIPADLAQEYDQYAGEIFEENEYDLEWDGEARAMYELAEEAHELGGDQDQIESILGNSQITDTQAAKQLTAYLGELRAQQAETKQAETEQPAERSEEVPGQPDESAQPEKTQPAATTDQDGQVDIFGGKSAAKQAIYDREQARQKKEREAPGMLEGDGDLFAGPAPKQETIPESKTTKPATKPEETGSKSVEEAEKAVEGEFIPRDSATVGEIGVGIDLKTVRDELDGKTVDSKELFGSHPVIQNGTGDLLIDQYEADIRYQGITDEGFAAWRDESGAWFVYDDKEKILIFGGEPKIESKIQLIPMPGETIMVSVPGRDEIELKGDKQLRTIIGEAEKEAATHPGNLLPEPTEAQKQAGNYKLGHVSLHGLDISIENPKGSTRSGTDSDGKEWSVTMKHTYGYIKGTVGKDKDHIDVFLGPKAEDASMPVFVVDQVNPETGKFDEHKVLLGFKNKLAAKKGYLDNYAKGWKGAGAVKKFSQDEFKEWLETGDTTKPVELKEKKKLKKKSSNNEARAEGTYGKQNKVFTEDAAAKARELLKKKLGTLNTGLDPEVFQAGVTLAGYHIEAGARSFAAYTKAMVGDLGDVVKPYLRGWYENIRYWPGFDTQGMSTPDEIEVYLRGNVPNRSDNLEPNRETAGDEKPGDGKTVSDDSQQTEPSTSTASRKPGKRRSQRKSDKSVSGTGSTSDRTPSNIDLFSETGELALETVNTRDTDSGRTTSDRNKGVLAERKRSEKPEKATRKHTNQVSDRAALQKSAESKPVELGDLDNIRDTLPILLEPQQEDVHFAEQRLFANNGRGVLFTNGTGTGKTFTGLGIIKRFVKQGKNNVLITVPGEKVSSDWIKSAKLFGLDVTQLKDIQDAGNGVVVTTYANFYQNESLSGRDWDLIVHDESHKLMENQAGEATSALGMMRALSGHPSGRYFYAQMREPELVSEMEALRSQIESYRKSDDQRMWQEVSSLEEKLKKVVKKWDKQLHEVHKPNRKNHWDKQKTKVVFLSATPFAYDKNIDYAEGFLFDFGKEPEGRGYNTPDARGNFFVTHFGYRMRYGKLTRPEAEVDSGLMERQFNQWLKEQGALRGRRLEVDKDYSREFIAIDDLVGNKIDEGLQWLSEKSRDGEDPMSEGFQEMLGKLQDRFDYHERVRLLEAIKAKHAIPRIKKHLGMGRKVVVFHSRIKGGGIHPFKFDKSGGSQIYKQAVERFNRERKDLVDLDLDSLTRPLTLFEKEFGDNVTFYNGTIPKKQKRENPDRFNQDYSNVDVIVVQDEGGKEGISLHDTTGVKQRALINLGLPIKPTQSIQIEGRIYRVGQQSDAIFEYFNTGTWFERWAFATAIAQRSSTAENLALGDEARSLKESFIDAFDDPVNTDPSANQGKGGKEKDKAIGAASPFEKAKTFYWANMKKRGRRDQREGIDYFSTPEPLGLKMVEWANIKANESAMEPSVGHGAIGRFFPENASNTFIEPSSELASRAALRTPGKVRGMRFEDLDIGGNKFDAIVMNPPFGLGGATAIQHLEKATKHLNNGGRIVALIPEGPAANKKLTKFLYGKNAPKNIFPVADVKLPTVTFERAGTAVNARILVLDRQDNPSDALEKVTRDYKDAETIKDFFDRIENSEIPARNEPTLTEKEKAAQEAKEQAVKSGVELVDGTHTKYGYPIFTVKLLKRLDRDVFLEYKDKAKKYDGYYSMYKGNGAVPGFIFREKENAESFLEDISKKESTPGGTTLYANPIEPVVKEAIKVFKKLRNSTVSRVPDSDFHNENRRIREEDRTIWDKATTMLRRQFTPGGLLPQEVFDEKITRDSEFEVVEFDVRHLVGQFERAVKKDFGKPAGELPESKIKLLDDALHGKVSSLIPENTKVAIVAMRRYIDQLSREYGGILFDQAKKLQAEGRDDQAAAKADLIMTIVNNLGEYVHRSYRAFDDPKWPKKVPDAVLDNARKYLVERYKESGETASEASRLTEITINEILKNGTAYDDMGAFIQESKLGAKDLSVLKRRKQIAPEIRALLGEYQDPRINFSKSATKMGRLIWNQRFLDTVLESGMGTFLFEGTNRPPEATKQIAAEGSKALEPLNGLWVTPEVNQAFKDALGKEQMANWYRTIVQLNGLVKFGKTVLSPTTAARNWQSAMFFSLANGHFDMRHMGKSIAGFKEYFTQQGSGARLQYLRKLKKLGVVYDTPYAGEMMRLLGDSRIEESLLTGKTRMTFRDAMGLAQKFYQYGDDFWKIIGFENEKQNLLKHTDMTEEQAEKEAAERIRNTYPTYSMVGRAIQSLRRFPLAGTFVSFPAEIIRTSYNMLKYIHHDMKDPNLRPIAIRRAIGLSFAHGIIVATAMLAKSWFDIDDDEEEAVRLLAAPWQRNSNLLFLGRDEKGALRYIDLSFLDPYNYFKRPITAILRDQPWEDKTADIFKETLTPFLGTDIAAGAIFEVMANKKESGAPVYKEHDMPVDQVKDIANHLRKTLQPGLASNLERTWRAIDDQISPSGRRYELGNEVASWAGWRVSTLDSKVALYYRSYEFKDALRDASKALKDVVTNPNTVSDNDLKEAYERTLKLRERAYKDFMKIIAAAMQSGLEKRDVYRALRNSNISKSDAASLMRGRIPRWSPSSASLRGAIRKAEVLFEKETQNEFKRRYKEVKRYQGMSSASGP